MTGHDRFRELAAVALDFDLREDERAVLEAHLAGCPACRQFAAGLRADAQAIAGLPVLVPVDGPRPRLFRPRTAVAGLRMAALAALVALLALGAAIVGAQLLPDLPPPLVVVAESPTPIVDPLLSPDPSVLAPSSSPAVGGWEVANVGEVGSLPEAFTAVASSGSTYVTVGENGCVAGEGRNACWAQVYQSTDGRTWTKADTAQTSLEVGAAITTSGPRPGMVDIAGSDQGFVAIGYTGDDVVTAAAWVSTDGLTWERLPDAPFAGAQLRAVANAGGRWIVAGAIFGGSAPRGAVWWSDDGSVWNRVRDSVVFDIGGYVDTGESPGAGGIQALASDGAWIVGVGSVCNAEGQSCGAATWTSTDGVSWERQEGLDVPGGGALNFGPNLVHGEAGFLALGSSCTEAGCVSIVVRSPDGRVWTEDSQAWSGELQAVAAVAGGFVVATSTETTPPGLALFASTDGHSWMPLAGVPSVEGGVLSAVDIAATGDGRAVVVAQFGVHDQAPVSVVLEVRPSGR